MTRCWIVTDGAAGNERQALALAQGLALEPVTLRIRLRAPWRWLAPRGPADPARVLDDATAASVVPPWPELAIGCGRAAALVLRSLHVRSQGRTRCVQILDPRAHRDDFDALVVPEHDRLEGDNVIECLGSLNAIDDAWLQAGRDRHDRLSALPSPRTAVLIGGPVRGLRLSKHYVDGLVERLAHWHRRDGGSFLVTCSRRTPPSLAARLRHLFTTWPGVFWGHDGDGDNPYAGLLGWAERIVVTPDSSNLLTEACATGVPVLAYMPRALPGKRGRLVRSLVESGRLRPLKLEYQPWRYAPLRELPRVTAQVRAMIGLD